MIGNWSDELLESYDAKFNSVFGKFSSKEDTAFPAADNIESGKKMFPGIQSTSIADARSRATSGGPNTWYQGDFYAGSGTNNSSMPLIVAAVVLGLILIFQK